MGAVITLVLFCAALISCIALNITIVPALLAGVIIFLIHGKLTGHTCKAMLRSGWHSMVEASVIVITFVLIGMLTALWRAAGTVPYIVTHATAVMSPYTVVVLTFLLNCLMSLLTGSAFASAATMGVITMTMGTSMQVNPVFLGGAMLAGVYFGDRCSPVSTSAQLVTTLTHTNIFDNIVRMLKTALIPFLITCAIYAALALCTHPSDASSLDIRSIFNNAFQLHWVCLIPALVLVVLALFRVDVRLVMLASIVAALPICLITQHMSWQEVGKTVLLGFTCADTAAGTLINGGGMLSMITVMLIVCISSSYTGIFRETGLLDGARARIANLAAYVTTFGATALTSIVTSAIACNQTLSIMLTHQLTDGLDDDNQRQAINLEDSAVVIAPLIPWSIAGAVPLASAQAPTLSIALACFLYLVPLVRTIEACISRHNARREAQQHADCTAN